MEKRKLHSVIAIEKGVKSRVYGEITTLHKESQKAEPFTGLVRTYRKKDEDGEDFPQERKKVQLVAEDVLKRVARLDTELFDVEAEKDWGNCKARASVIVDGRTIVADAPPTFLLFLEKQLSDLRTFVEKLPVLDEAEEWTADPNSSLHRTSPSVTHKTRKVQRAIVKYDAVIKDGLALPAQTEMITEDVIVGWWDTVKHSGALPAPRKEALLDRIDKLTKAVKIAREEANDTEIEERSVGAALFGFLFQ
jgi:hypothetical protein